MELAGVLWIYIIIIFVIFAFLWKQSFNFWESLIISLTIGLIFLLLVHPPQELDMETENLSCSALYIFIIVLTFTIILIYAIAAAYGNRISRQKCDVLKEQKFLNSGPIVY